MSNLSVDISEEIAVNKNYGESDKFNRSDIYQLTCPDDRKKYTGQTGTGIMNTSSLSNI